MSLCFASADAFENTLKQIAQDCGVDFVAKLEFDDVFNKMFGEVGIGSVAVETELLGVPEGKTVGEGVWHVTARARGLVGNCIELGKNELLFPDACFLGDSLCVVFPWLAMVCISPLEDKVVPPEFVFIADTRGDNGLGLEIGVVGITSGINECFLFNVGDSMKGIGDCWPLPVGELSLAETLSTVSFSCDKCL